MKTLTNRPDPLSSILSTNKVEGNNQTPLKLSLIITHHKHINVMKKTRKASKQSRGGELAPPENASFHAWRPEFDLQKAGKQVNGAWWWALVIPSVENLR